jgi:Zn-dependent metalloprotease
MKAKTLIVLGMLAVLALMVVPALALSPLAAMSSAPAAAAVSWEPLAKPAVASVSAETAQPLDQSGIERLLAATDGAVQVSVSRATGAVRFIAVSPAQPDALSALLAPAKEPQVQAAAFWAVYGSLFGLDNPAQQLKFVGSRTDSLGATRLEYRQVYEGVPVFAGILFVHFNARNQMTAINGVSVPDIAVSAQPRLSAEQVNQIAINAVGPTGLQAARTTLYIYRTGLAQGVKGISYLAYEVEVTNGVNVRDFVIVDAQTGKIIDRWSAIADGMIREVYSGTFAAPALVWQEGDAFPFTGVFSEDINNLIYGGAEVYNTFSSAFSRDSYDAAGAILRTVNNDPTIACPNANWNGITTNYCNGVTSDDVVAHEWGHAYTEYTHGLIYAWQPGALNESYSDIWGEVVDLLNGRGTDAPGGSRALGICSAYSPARTELVIQPPSPVAGSYASQAAAFGPPLTSAGVTGTVVLADNGSGGTLGCTASGGISNTVAISGNVALIDRGICTFAEKVKNAQNAGAIAVIIANNAASGLPGMGGSDATIVIPSLGVTKGAGDAIKANSPLSATLRSKSGTTDNSYRWLMGEDSSAFGGAIRDMWEPNCYGDPSKVTDTAFYICDSSDNGGVHTNSGVSNHTFALLVDGGSFNGYTVTAIGLTKAAHLYWRAEDIYQTPTTDFADHADALTTSCNDLVAAGANLPALSTSISTTVLSGQVFTTTDCVQVAQAIAATELRTPPAQCNFQPLLNPSTPALCSAGTVPVTFFADTFEAPSGWTVTHTDVYSATNYEWVRRGSLPNGRTGQAFFAADEVGAGNCSGGIGDVSRVVYLTSPSIAVPTSTTALRLAFDHWMATEALWDGGNVWISVNGGVWQPISTTNFTFNPYNANINTVGQGNTNPLAGQRGFTGSDGGEVTGSWGTSLLNLQNYAAPGDSIQLRYALGTDGCSGLEGWYVDDVEAYYCVVSAYGLALTPAIAAQIGNPGANVAYTLHVTNTGNTADTVTVTVAGNAWPTAAPASVGPLAAGASASLVVTVTVPVNAAGGASDGATVTATSQGDPGQSASSTLTTTVNAPAAISINAPASVLVGKTVTATARVTGTNGLPMAGQPVFFSTNSFGAVMSGLYEVPPNLSTGTGTLYFWYNPATMQLTYSGAVSGLGNNVTAAHIHTGTFGVPGGVLVPLSYITTTNGAIFSGTATLGPASEVLLYNGGLYANVHTSGFPSGEVRGQLLEGVFSSLLTGSQEVPPVSTAGKGAVYFTFNASTGLIEYHGQVSGLNSNVTASHIHTGTAGSTGGVIVPLSYVTVTNGLVYSGSLNLSQMATLVANFQNGLYVNVHTTSNPSGEVRGQIMTGLYVPTDLGGLASIPVTSSTPGTVTVTAIVGAVRASTSVVFEPYRLFLPYIAKN